MAFAETLPESASSPTDPETGGTLTIDLEAVEANWRALAHKLLTVECAAVVKANAYGLGLEPVTAKLAKAGCKTFFVADLAEARRVRTRAREASIYVLNGFAPEAGTAFAELDARRSSTAPPSWRSGTPSSPPRTGDRGGNPCGHRHEQARHFPRGAAALAAALARTRITASRC